MIELGGPSPSGPRSGPVLIVEDDDLIRTSVAMFLQSEGYAVVEARNGVEAIDHLKKGVVPSVVLLDLMMPHMSGEEFCEERQRLGLADKAPVIVVSAQLQRAAALKGRCRVEGVVEKPFQLEELLRVVAEYADRQ